MSKKYVAGISMKSELAYRNYEYDSILILFFEYSLLISETYIIVHYLPLHSGLPSHSNYVMRVLMIYMSWGTSLKSNSNDRKTSHGNLISELLLELCFVIWSEAWFVISHLISQHTRLRRLLNMQQSCNCSMWTLVK